MKVSLLISSYNGMKHLVVLLDSIRNLELDGHDLEVIIRDDNSSDGTPDKLSLNYPWVKLIRGDRNIGFSNSNNLLFEQASGDVLCFVNQDSVLKKNFLLEGLAALKSHPDAVGVNTNMIMPWVMSLENFRSLQPEDLPSFEYRLTPFGIIEYTSVEKVMRETNFMTGGGFFLISSALSKGEKLFDPGVYMYCEDNELSLRLRNRGGKIIYSPKAILYHNHAPIKASTLRELKKFMRITWNRFYVMARHNTPWEFLRHYPLYVWGISKKMNYLGLPPKKKLLAYLAGGCLAVPFSLLLPYWFWLSIKLKAKDNRF
jgi:GT2 family glycosyltransferase